MHSQNHAHVYPLSLALLFCFALAFPVFGQPAPESPYTYADYVEPGFPFITTTLDASNMGPDYPARNIAVRCLVLMLGNDTYACFDTDLLRVAAVWQGEFPTLTTMATISYHTAGNKKNGIPTLPVEPVIATGVYPGWLPEGGSFTDPRPSIANPNEAGRGPVDPSLARWGGVYVNGTDAVLSYTVQGADIREMMSSLDAREGFRRALEIKNQAQPLRLVLGEINGAVRVESDGDKAAISTQSGVVHIQVSGDADDARLAIIDDRYVTLEIEPAGDRKLQVAVWKSTVAGAQTLDTSPAFPDFATQTEKHWNEPVVTRGSLGSLEPGSVIPYVLDIISLPLPNPWQRNMRVAGLDFFSDGRAAVSTFGGDVWLLDGLDDALGELTWTRYASGLYEPMSLSIVDDEVYVFGREGIIRLQDLNEDGEADFYENFSNLPVQTIESREFPLSMHPDPEGGFYVSKGAAQNNGPPTSPPIMNGFRAGGPHSGTVLKVSADGRSVSIFATGLREPYIGVHPVEGWVTSSDQQGHFVPSSPIYFIQEGEYYGVPATSHQDVPPPIALPLTWAPHSLDRSGTEQVWAVSDAFGPLSGALIHLSYGRPGIYKVYHEVKDGKLVQGAIAELPLTFTGPLMEGAVHPGDGQVYVGGFQVWDSNAREISSLYRVRYVEGKMLLPASINFGQQGVLVRFDVELDPAEATDLSKYTVERWDYKRTEQYGSGYFKLNGEPGKEVVRLLNAQLTRDRKGVFLHVGSMPDAMQMGLSYSMRSASGDSLDHSIYFSVHDAQPLDLDKEGITLDREAAAASAARVVAEPVKTASVDEGQRLYQQIGCIGCHSSDGSTAGRTGPTFKGLIGRSRTFNDGTSIVADEAYVKESIWDPGARVVEGLDVAMPSYQGILDDVDVQSLILFIKSLE